MNQFGKIPYDKSIENFVKKYALTGKNVQTIFDLAKGQGFQNMPASRTTFNKLYKPVVDQIKFDKIAAVADKVYARALGVDANGNPDAENPDGHYPAQELILTTQANWSKTQVNVDVEVQDDDGSAKNALLAALGLEEYDDDSDERG